MPYSFTDHTFLQYAAAMTLFIVLTFLITELVRLLLYKNKRGLSAYIIAAALIAAVIPFHIQLLPSLLDIRYFDILLWVKGIPAQYGANADEQGVMLVQNYQNNGDVPQYLTLSMLLFAVWAAGAAVSAITEVIRFRRLASDINKYAVKYEGGRYDEILAEEYTGRKPQLLIYSKASTPFVTGLIHPKIILPTDGYSDDEIRLILRHELTHIARKDILAKCILVSIRCLNWYDPAAYILCRRAFEDMEMSVDEWVTRNSDEDEKRLYSTLIVSTAAKSRMPDCTTYLSLNGKTLKKRIASVLEKRRSSLLPTVLTVTAVFMIYMMIVPTYRIWAAAPMSMWVYYRELPIEADSINSDEELKIIRAVSYEDAARKYIELLLYNYADEKTPEYLRIEDYFIYPEVRQLPAASTGLLNSMDTKYVQVSYLYETTNKCGNTAHDQMIFTPCFNGLNYNINTLAVKKLNEEGEHGEKLYRIEGRGIDNTTFFTNENYHFSDNIADIERYFGVLAENGLLDTDQSDGEAIRDRIVEIEREYDDKRVAEGKASSPYVPQEPSKRYFEYCGYKAELDTGTVYIYGNVYTEKPHGVKITCYNTPGNLLFTFSGRGSSRLAVTVTDMYPSIEYHDSFDSIDFAGLSDEPTAENAAARLEYMKTPRDGTDFTVLAYDDIREENGVIYADVRFKGRLEGVYSESGYISGHGGDGNWFMEAVPVMK